MNLERAPSDERILGMGPTLLVLAAGLGSRYGALKQIEPIGAAGETILDYSVYDALRAGFTKVVFVIRREIERAFKEKIGARFETRVQVEYVYQELDALPPGFHAPEGRTKPWGTTHAVLVAASAIHGPFAVVNADDFYGARSYRVLAEHLATVNVEYAMAGFVLRNTLSETGSVARGICHLGSDGFLESVVELTNIQRDGARAINIDPSGEVRMLTTDEVVSMNMWGFTPTVFGQLLKCFESFLLEHGADLKAESYLPSAINELISRGQARVKVLQTLDAWFGVTNRGDRQRAVESLRQLIAAGDYPARLWA